MYMYMYMHMHIYMYIYTYIYIQQVFSLHVCMQIIHTIYTVSKALTVLT